jgi:hypothetical protein
MAVLPEGSLLTFASFRSARGSGRAGDGSGAPAGRCGASRRHEEKTHLPPWQRNNRHAEDMTFPHCPLCVALAVMCVLRASSHLVLVGLRLTQVPAH